MTTTEMPKVEAIAEPTESEKVEECDPGSGGGHRRHRHRLLDHRRTESRGATGPSYQSP